MTKRQKAAFQAGMLCAKLTGCGSQLLIHASECAWTLQQYLDSPTARAETNFLLNEQFWDEAREAVDKVVHRLRDVDPVDAKPLVFSVSETGRISPKFMESAC